MTNNMTSPDINFFIYLFLNKALFYHIDNNIGLNKKILLLPKYRPFVKT